MDELTRQLAERNQNRLFYDVSCKEEDKISFLVVAKTKSGHIVEVNLGVRIADTPVVSIESREIKN